MTHYSHLLSPLALVAEDSYTNKVLTERHLQAIWFEQKWFRPFFTFEGEQIEIISAGYWNREAGPDFLHAHLRIGSKEYKGDVELHLKHEGWSLHKHQYDPNYNHVVLHLSYENPVCPRPIIKQNGQKVLSLALVHYLKVPIEKLLNCIDLELYPYRKIAQPGHCASTIFNIWPQNKVINFFQKASEWRLEKKGEYLRNRCLHKQQQFLLGLSMALGYRHNAEAFSDLFELLFEYRLLSENELLAIAMGASGFFDGQQKKSWNFSPYYSCLRYFWWEIKDQITLQVNLRLDRIRPLNHPIRRLIYLIKLIQCSENLWDSLLNEWKKDWIQLFTTKKVHFLQKKLLCLIPTLEDLYWNTHYTFERAIQKQKLTLIGVDLKREILVNAFLPLLYHEIKEEADVYELKSFQKLYASFKSRLTSKARYLNFRFFADSIRKTLMKNTQIEQGAYQLHKDFCVNFESSCAGCPFIERMQLQVEHLGF